MTRDALRLEPNRQPTATPAIPINLPEEKKIIYIFKYLRFVHSTSMCEIACHAAVEAPSGTFGNLEDTCRYLIGMVGREFRTDLNL
jgi:hypothetical protein